MGQTRGPAISAYSPAFARGAKVYGANIQSGAVTSAHIASGTVVASDIKDSTVTSAKIGAAAVTNAKMKAAFLSGTISGLAAGAAVAIAHSLGVVPKFATVNLLATGGETTAKNVINLAAASAATSANIYVVSSKAGNVKYVAYVQV